MKSGSTSKLAVAAAVAAATLSSPALAARPFLNEPDNGQMDVFGDVSEQLPNLENIVGLTDFEWAAEQFLPLENYTYYRNAAGGEWSYRNNLEAFHRYTFKPRMMRDVSNLENTTKTKILGYEFDSPFFIAPCARAAYGHPDGELNLVRAAGEENILYVPSSSSSRSSKEIADARAPGQVTFQQLYLPKDESKTESVVRDVERSGAKAIVLTIDAPTSGDRQRAFRQRGSIPELDIQPLTWNKYKQVQNMTSLPLVLKGIQSVEDAAMAVEAGAPAIVLSNHGGRQLDDTPSPLEIALKIYKERPEIFQQTEVWADGGVRYGTDVIKLLALGVKAVGLGRPFMYANIYGQEGVEQAIYIMKRQLLSNAANLGVTDLQNVDPNMIDWEPNGWNS